MCCCVLPDWQQLWHLLRRRSPPIRYVSTHSGKNAIMRGAMKDPPNYVYESPVNFKIPDSGVEIAITTATIGDYNPLPTYGYNYFIDASRKSPTSNYIVYQLLMNNDLSWSSIQLSYLVSARSDMAIGNL